MVREDESATVTGSGSASAAVVDENQDNKNGTKCKCGGSRNNACMKVVGDAVIRNQFQFNKLKNSLNFGREEIEEVVVQK
ncbi:MAG: hypothetical protein CM15mP110_3470 [Alphaproteobacteria bacterium]|nr:MAG: hypothetical protein CM15mP110_3470 [Alphaproteobacteria bacterium]